MLNTLKASRGMVVAPHHLAAQSGLAVLREGGNAIEAMVAAASTISVVYPHMNSIGGDGFWLIAEPGKAPVGIDACGAAAELATIEFYERQGFSEIPFRGPLAALTVAGTVGGWAKALEISSEWGGIASLPRLLADAVFYAENGFPETVSQRETLREKWSDLKAAPGFEPTFGQTSEAIFKNRALGTTLQQLASNGLDDFYRGRLAASIADELEAMGSPLRFSDFEQYRAQIVKPLSVRLKCGEVFNLPPPTQGIASLLILALYDRIAASNADSFDHVHRLVEATKCAFRVREQVAIDPSYLDHDLNRYFCDEFLAKTLLDINEVKAKPWPAPKPDFGDTVWMGAIDSAGRAVSFIQSIYWEFGSGVVLPSSGINWQNRGTSFSLDPKSSNPLMSGRKPFHTLNPAFARLSDGRIVVYGTMGGEGQPQTQAAVFSRIAMHEADVQTAITLPRWLLGRTWGSPSTTLKLESRFSPKTVEALRKAGHIIELVDEFTSTMGHAGAIVSAPDSGLSGASDPRSDGAVAAF